MWQAKDDPTTGRHVGAELTRVGSRHWIEPSRVDRAVDFCVTTLPKIHAAAVDAASGSSLLSFFDGGDSFESVQQRGDAFKSFLLESIVSDATCPRSMTADRTRGLSIRAPVLCSRPMLDPRSVRAAPSTL
jgi:hypothetical protein